MTTPASGSGRPSAIHRTPARRAIRRSYTLLAAVLIATAALPAVAADAGDPMDIAPRLLAAPGGAELFDAVPARSLAYNADVRSVFDAIAVPREVVAPAVVEAPKEGRIKRMLKRALALLGTPYRWGGSSPESGFDCSGLVGYVYRDSLGIELPRISRDMANVGELIRERESLIEGDLVFFSRRGKHIDHVGIYIGNGQFVHAPRTGKDVEIANLAAGYWSHKFMQARRVAPQHD